MTLEDIDETAAFLRGRTEGFEPEAGIILGSGLAGLVDQMEIEHEIPYRGIPNFPLATVEFHRGRLLFGRLAGKKVVVMQGRFHYYEGYSAKQITFPVRVMRQLGVKRLYVSNAAGSLNPDYQISDLMILSDHINLQPDNPLRGPNLGELGDRFPDMLHCYEPAMVSAGLAFCQEKQIAAQAGVYVAVTGPNLETVAEYRFLRIIGGDAVGMSTVPEVIVARQMNLPVFAVSVITDIGVPGHVEPVSIDRILEAAAKAEPNMTALITHLVGQF